MLVNEFLIRVEEELVDAVIVKVDKPKTSREQDLEDKAYKEGFNDGFEKFKKELEEKEVELKKIKFNFVKVLEEEFIKFKDNILIEVPMMLIEMVNKIWSKAALDGVVLKGIVQEILDEWSPKNEKLEVYLNKEDLGKIEEYVRGVEGNIGFFVDEKLGAGDCLIKSRFGLIDGRIENKIKNFEKEITKNENNI